MEAAVPLMTAGQAGPRNGMSRGPRPRNGGQRSPGVGGRAERSLCVFNRELSAPGLFQIPCLSALLSGHRRAPGVCFRSGPSVCMCVACGWQGQARCPGRWGGREGWGPCCFSFHGLCDKQLGVVGAVCLGVVVPEETYCYPKWTERLCSLASPGASPAPCPGWSLGPCRAPRLTAAGPQPLGHQSGRSLEPCTGLAGVALSCPQWSERSLLPPLPSPLHFLPVCLQPRWAVLREARRGGSDGEAEAEASEGSPSLAEA